MTIYGIKKIREKVNDKRFIYWKRLLKLLFTMSNLLKYPCDKTETGSSQSTDITQSPQIKTDSSPFWVFYDEFRY